MAIWSSSKKALPETEVSRRSVLNITLILYLMSLILYGWYYIISYIRPAALISACGNSIQVYSAALLPLQYVLQRWWCVTIVTTTIWRRSQSLHTALLRSEVWLQSFRKSTFSKVFSQTNNPPATSHLAHIPA